MPVSVGSLLLLEVVQTYVHVLPLVLVEHRGCRVFIGVLHLALEHVYRCVPSIVLEEVLRVLVHLPLESLAEIDVLEFSRVSRAGAVCVLLVKVSYEYVGQSSFEFRNFLIFRIGVHHLLNVSPSIYLELRD